MATSQPLNEARCSTSPFRPTTTSTALWSNIRRNKVDCGVRCGRSSCLCGSCFSFPFWPIFWFSLLMKFTTRTDQNFRKLANSNSIYVCSTILGQAEYFNHKKLSLRILMAIWLLMTLILVNSYTGNLISYLTVSKLNPIANSYEDLANSSDSALTVSDSSILTGRILVNLRQCFLRSYNLTHF